jgi:hypothetical protein
MSHRGLSNMRIRAAVRAACATALSLLGASTAMAQVGPSLQPLASLPGLSSITIYEDSGHGTNPKPYDFSQGDSRLFTRIQTLSSTNRDFSDAWVNNPPHELYDAFYSDGNGNPNPNGSYLTVECLSVGPGDGNISEAYLNFGSQSVHASAVTSYRLGSGGLLAKIPSAVDGDRNTCTQLGASSSQTTRTYITLDFPFPTTPVTQTARAPSNCYTTISNGAGSHLVVFNPVSGRFDGTQIDRTLPTIVITHGLWDGVSVLDSSIWQSNLAKAIRDSGNSGNIVAWDWSQDANADLALATTRTLVNGNRLAIELNSALGSNYTQPIHFMGHSLGTLVDAQAITDYHSLNATPIIQDTLFDQANIANVVASGGKFATSTWASPIPADHSTVWIENYVSQFGHMLNQAVNVILDESWDPAPLNPAQYPQWVVDWHGYPIRWYIQTIQNPTASLMGYRYDVTHVSLNGDQPAAGTVFLQDVKSQPYASELGLTKVPDLVYAPTTFNTAAVTPGNLAGPIQVNGDVTVSLQPQSQSANGVSSTVLGLNITAVKHSPAYAWVPIAIPNDGLFVSFDFQFDGLSSGDYMAVGINDNLLFEMSDQFISEGQPHNTGLIDISQWAGQNVTLFLGLNAADQLNAGGKITYSNFEFVSVPEPASALIVIAGALGLVVRPRRRGRESYLQRTL